ncbi:unnamed protein product, partial [marine sediment metagenome]
MPRENDQTRWIGIRPTTNCGNIPVAVASMPACNKVEPCAANNAFNVITKKLTPAIADLQAPESFVRIKLSYQATASATYNHFMYTVPGGKIFCADFASGNCSTGNPTKITFNMKSGVDFFQFETYPYGGAAELHFLHKQQFLNEGEKFYIQY